MKTSLGLELQLRSAGIDERLLLQSMGYARPTAKTRQRLREAIRNPAQFLEGSSFDFKYSSAAFLKRLGTLLGLEFPWLDAQIAILKEEDRAEATAFQPYLFIDTGFVRRSQPVFALALLDHQRYLRFPKGFWRFPLHEQVARAQQRVREHVAETRGHLGLWGQVRRYVLHFAPSGHVVIDPNGQLTAEVAKPPGAAVFGKPLQGAERLLRVHEGTDA